MRKNGENTEVNPTSLPDQVTGPLDGIKVLDLSRILAGPTCTQLMGDYGADVVKVEKPASGDDTRKWGPPYLKDANGNETNESAYYLSSNRNKRSIGIDIASQSGASLVRELALKCDVFIENFKVGALERYGLHYEALRKIKPDIVYCSISGFGQTGPNSHLAGYDLMAQGYGGLMSLNGEPEGQPMKVGVGIADAMCGMYAATAILAALRHRDIKGEGQHIDIALVDTQIAWLINEGANYLNSGKLPVRRGNQHPNIVPYQVFSAKDGHLLVAVGNDTQFVKFCKILGCTELAEDPLYATNIARVNNREALIEQLVPLIAEFEKDNLLEIMAQVSVPGGPIHKLDEVFESDQVKARGMQVSLPHSSGTMAHLIGNPVNFSKTPVSYSKAPPVCGEHNDEILADWLGK